MSFIALLLSIHVHESASKPWWVPSCCDCMDSDEEPHVRSDPRLIRRHRSDTTPQLQSQTSSLSQSRNPLVPITAVSGLTSTSYLGSGLTYLESTPYSEISGNRNSKSWPTQRTKDLVSDESQTNWEHVNKISHAMQSMQPFIMRKHELTSATTALFDSVSDIIQQNATLLVLDGRHTIFDSMPFSETIVKILTQHEVPFIASQNYYHTLNIIRPDLIEFVQRMVDLSNPHPLHLVVYVNSANVTQKDIDELLSVITFLELCFDVQQIKQNFKVVLLSDEEYKSDRYLSNFVPFYAYQHIMVVDHHGLNAWKFDEWVYQQEYKTSAVLKRRKEQFIPIQISSFNLDQHEMINDAHSILSDSFNTLLTVMGFDISGINSRFFADFTKRWIKIRSQEKRLVSPDAALSGTADSVLEQALVTPRLLHLKQSLNTINESLLIMNESSEQTAIQSFSNEEKKTVNMSLMDNDPRTLFSRRSENEKYWKNYGGTLVQKQRQKEEKKQKYIESGVIVLQQVENFTVWGI